MGDTNRYKKYLRHHSSKSIDEKIQYLNGELKKTNMVSEMMTTANYYSVLGMDSGVAATPDTPAVDPTYADVDAGGLTGNGDDFEWPDQGDGSDADAATVIPDNLYTTYNGEQIAAIRPIETYNGENLDYGDYPSLGGIALRGGWLNWSYLGYLSGSGVRSVGTTASTTTDLARAIYDAYRNWPYPGKIVKTVYQWQSLDCLLGTCRSGSQYYPEGSSNTSNPRAERALYAWTIWLPADADGNLIRNRVQTDPGSPLIPGDPGRGPLPYTISRHNIGDSSYYPGYIGTEMQGQLDIGPRGYNYIDQKSFEYLYGTKSGREIARIADAGLVSIPVLMIGVKILLGAGMVALTAYAQQQGWGPEIVNAVINLANSMSGGNTDASLGPDYENEYQRRVRERARQQSAPRERSVERSDSPQKQAEREAADQQIRDAEQEIKDAEESGNKERIDRAYDNYEKAVKNRQRVRQKQKTDREAQERSLGMPESHNPIKSDKKILSEGWHSPAHADVDRDSKNRWLSPNAGTDSKKWFDPEQVAPIYPKNPPPEMINGYSARSRLAPREIDGDPFIKLTKKDLTKNHKLTDIEIGEMMDTIDRINNFLAAHPEELIYARRRYPKHDSRLAELNWKMDQMLRASEEYIGSQFPENEKLFKKLQKATKKTIELTDPKTYEKDPGALSSIGSLSTVERIMKIYNPESKKDKQIFIIKIDKSKSPTRFLKKDVKKEKPRYLRSKKRKTE